MSQTRIRCPACKQLVPVLPQDLEKTVVCPQCRVRFQPARLNEYVLLDELGHGAFSAVHLAYDLRNGREIALKQLDDKGIPEHEFAEWAERAVAEARALAQIDFHPNVLPMYNSGHLGKKFFLVSPVIRGKSLDKLIPEHGFPDPLRAVEFAVLVLRALHHVHGFNVYHRDVKPSNIMIDEEGHLFLIDFGIVAIRQPNRAIKTRLGTVMGTPAYMPPEQALGDVKRVGPRSDQYGAGAVLYHMLTGKVPFPGGDPYTVIGDVVDPNKLPLPPRHFRPELDPALEALVLTSLRKAPGERFENCAQFADRLQAWAEEWKQRQVLGARPPENPRAAAAAPGPAARPVPKVAPPTRKPGQQPPPTMQPAAATLPGPASAAPGGGETSGQPGPWRTLLWTVIALAALAALVGGGYLAWKQSHPSVKFDDITK
jgi:serine/threonine-protein kinase